MSTSSAPQDTLPPTKVASPSSASNNNNNNNSSSSNTNTNTNISVNPNNASIPLQIEETGKVIRVGVNLFGENENNNDEENTQQQPQQQASAAAAVSAGMLRAMIQSRFSDAAQLCTQEGQLIPDDEIIWARDESGSISVRPKLQIASSSSAGIIDDAKRRDGSSSSSRRSEGRQQQQQQNIISNNAVTDDKDDENNSEHRIASELTQQVHQRERQLHVARTLLDTDRLKWNQQLDILRQLRNVALQVLQAQREDFATRQDRQKQQQHSSMSGNENNNEALSIQELVQKMKRQQMLADEIIAKQEVKRLEIAAAEKTLASIQNNIDSSLAAVDISAKPQHAAAPQFFKDEILKIACNQVHINSIEDEIEEIQSEIGMLRKKRRDLVEHHEEERGHVRVVVRQRPYLELVDGMQPRRLGAPEVGDVVVDEASRIVSVSSPATGQKDFEFVNVFAPHEQQQEENSLIEKQTRVFDSEIVPLLRESIAKGTDSNFIFYGATSAGKSFCVFGNPANTEEEDCPGLLEMALTEIVEFAGEADVQASELYLDQRSDLLDPQKQNPNSNKKTSSSSNNNNCCWIRVNTVKHGVRLVRKAALRRVTARTLTNEVSSRSHMIVSIRFPALSGDGKIHRVTVTFVDLAGSERLARSLSTGDRLKEAQHINRSLSALGDVVHALAGSSNHIPYRNSKLTQLLQSALGGSSRTMLMLCLPPHLPEQHNMSEIVSTLSFGVRARGVRNK